MKGSWGMVTGADCGVSPSWLISLNFTGANHGFLPPSAFMDVEAELRQGTAQLRVLRKRNSSGKASSDAGPELAGRESCVAMESPQALMCPLEKGVRGIEISGLCRCSVYPS